MQQGKHEGKTFSWVVQNDVEYCCKAQMIVSTKPDHHLKDLVVVFEKHTRYCRRFLDKVVKSKIKIGLGPGARCYP
jgi:hypothetical protein